MRSLIVAMAVLAAAAAPASAAELHMEGTTAVYTGDPTSESITVGGNYGPGFFELSDNGRATVTDGPCSRQSFSIVCPADQVTNVRFDLGDGDDTFTVQTAADGATSTPLPLTINGGNGNDVLAGDVLGDTIDGGAGNDDIPSNAGNDTVNGGPGTDSIRAGDGDDTLDGGPGDDFVNGMNGNDLLKPGTGKDDLRGGAGNDVLDMRNGEVDKGEAACEEGTDSLALDPNDNVLEFQDGNGGWRVEQSCETVTGQTLAPMPVNVFIGSRKSATAVTVDQIEALPTTLKIEFLVGKTVVSRATAKRRTVRTTLSPKRTPAGRKYAKRHPIVITMRLTVTDSGGRQRVVTRKRLALPTI